MFSNLNLKGSLDSVSCKRCRGEPSSVHETFWREINWACRHARKHAIKLRSYATLKNKATQWLAAVVNFEINFDIKWENSQYPTPILVDRDRHVDQGLDSIITNRSRQKEYNMGSFLWHTRITTIPATTLIRICKTLFTSVKRSITEKYTSSKQNIPFLQLIGNCYIKLNIWQMRI